jgi:hypothetical protein
MKAESFFSYFLVLFRDLIQMFHKMTSNIATKTPKHQISPKLTVRLFTIAAFWCLGVLVAYMNYFTL